MPRISNTGRARFPVRQTPHLVLITLSLILFNSDSGFADPRVPTDWTLEPSRVGWTRIGLRARKFFLSGTTDANLSTIAGECTNLLSPDEGNAIQPGSDIAILRIATNALGIRSTAALWMDARSGAAIQYEVRDSGRRNRERSYRYTDAGAFHWTRYPEKGEEKEAPSAWSRTESGMRDYPPSARGERIIDPVGLLYILAASDMDQPGDSMEFVIYARRRVARLTITAEKFVDLNEAIDGNKYAKSHAGIWQATEALVFRLTPKPMTAGEEMKFDFLGLNRDIEIFLEPRTRLPLRISGKAKIVGNLSINLEAAELASGSDHSKRNDCAH